MSNVFYPPDGGQAIAPAMLKHSRRRFYEIFVGPADRTQFIRWMAKNWVRCAAYLRPGMVNAHLHGNEVYGCYGGMTTNHACIDHDLHGGNPTIFFDQMKILLPDLIGHGWHLQVPDQVLSGVHYICFFGQSFGVQTLRGQLRNWLLQLDDSHPDLKQAARRAGMKSFGDLEVYPNPDQGVRLPLSVGRTMLIDRPLALVENRRTKRGMVQNVEGYVNWLDDPQRRLMPTDAVLQYVGAIPLPVRPTGSHSKLSPFHTGNQGAVSGLGSIASLKGRFVRELVQFWTGTNQQPDTLNQWIAMTARMLQFEVDEQTASATIERFIDDLPNVGFSDRLSNGNRKEVSRVILSTVSAIFSGKDQTVVKPENLSATHSVIAAAGFRVADKSTWHNVPQPVPGRHIRPNEFGPDFDWSPVEEAWIDSVMCDILKTNAVTARRVTKQFIRYLYLRCFDETPITAIPKILNDPGVKWGQNKKKSDFVGCLLKRGWITIITDYWNGKSSSGKGRARRYGVNQEFIERMRKKFLSTPPAERQHQLSLADQSAYERGIIQDRF